MPARPTKKTKTEKGKPSNDNNITSLPQQRSNTKLKSPKSKLTTKSSSSSSSSPKNKSVNKNNYNNSTSNNENTAISSSNGLFSYLQSLDREVLTSLYSTDDDNNNDDTSINSQIHRGSYAAKTILQKLPELARQFVIRLSVCGGAVPVIQMETWVAGSGAGSNTSDSTANNTTNWNSMKPPTNSTSNNNCNNSKAKLRIVNALKRMEGLYVIEPLPPSFWSLFSNNNNNNNNNNVKKRRKKKDKNQEDGEKDDSNDDTTTTNKESNSISSHCDWKRVMIKLIPQFQKAIRIAITKPQSSPYPEIKDPELLQYKQLESKASSSDKNKNKSTWPSQTPSFDELESFTQKRWNSVLHYLVGERYYEQPPAAIIQFLEQTGLMNAETKHLKKRRNSDLRKDYHDKNEEEEYKSTTTLEITSKGYEFMLCDVHVQVWRFVLQYLNLLNNPKKTREAILFLICLSYCKVGAVYPMSALSKITKSFCKDFCKFGLVYVCRVGGCKMFLPTKVAVNLIVGSLNNTEDYCEDDCMGTDDNKGEDNLTTTEIGRRVKIIGVGPYSHENINPPPTTQSAIRTLCRALEAPLSLNTPPSDHIAIIVQTNFQVCAYTTSTVHISMLGLFCEERTFRRLPNVVFFRITRDTVKRAFQLGITAGQILIFLKMHAHPHLREGGANDTALQLIPSNVEDQIILWDRERRRVKFTQVYKLLCRNKDEFEAFRTYATNRNYFAWGNASNREIMVKMDCAEAFMAFVWSWRRGDCV